MRRTMPPSYECDLVVERSTVEELRQDTATRRHDISVDVGRLGEESVERGGEWVPNVEPDIHERTAPSPQIAVRPEQQYPKHSGPRCGHADVDDARAGEGRAPLRQP